MDQYGDGNFTGTVASNLGVNATGDIIETIGIRTGATLPIIPVEGEMFLHCPTGRCVLMQYDGAAWNPIQSYGTMTLYVDATDGTNDPNLGTAIGEDAFATIQYAFDKIPPVYGGNVIIYLSGEAYAETCILQGKSPTGSFTITLQGTVDVISSHTCGTGNLAGTYSANVSHQYAKLVRDTGTWTANEVQNKWVKVTSGNNEDEYAVIDSNDTTSIRPLGRFIGGAFVDSTDTFDICEPITSITDLQIGTNQKNVIVQDIDLTISNGTNTTLFGSYSQVKLIRCNLVFTSVSSIWIPFLSDVTFDACYCEKLRIFVRGGTKAYINATKMYTGGGSNRCLNVDESGTLYINNGSIIEGISAVYNSGLATINCFASNFRNTIRNATTGITAEMNGIALLTNSAYLLFGDDKMPNAEEAATATTANKLVDTSVNFTTIGVAIGDKVVNLTDKTSALVTAVDSATQLSLDTDIMVSGERYRILDKDTLCTTETLTATGGQIA
jgi:hypothetical protein